MESTVYSTAVGDNDYLNDKELRQLFHTSELEAFKGVFDLYDIDGDQTISVQELSKIMQTLG